MYEDDKFKDFKFTVNGQSVLVHKTVLIYRCEYFKRLLEQEMTNESPQNELEMDDFELPVIRNFVKYLYTEKITNGEASFELMILADHFGMCFLKDTCEKILVRNVNEQNAIDYLINGDKSNSCPLKQRALCVIKDHICTIRKGKDYKNLRDHPHLFECVVDLFVNDEECNRRKHGTCGSDDSIDDKRLCCNQKRDICSMSKERQQSDESSYESLDSC